LYLVVLCIRVLLMTMSSAVKIDDVILLHGGGLSSDVAERIGSKLPPSVRAQKVSMSKIKEFKAALLDDDDERSGPITLAIFIVQTIENESPPEDAGPCVRFLMRRTHPDTLLSDGGVRLFAVLGLGDSNLLLDRQHTSAKDCNQVARVLDSRLEGLGGTRFCDRGECDERTGLLECEPWIDMLVEKIECRMR
jgi:sulfite reductase alpha subunit-like flavoprotein